MTRTQSLFFRFILSLVGAGIILLAFFLFNRNKELSDKDIFMWISIVVMYLVFFTPFFFSAINTGNFSGKIPSVVIIWSGIFAYIPVSIGIIVLLQFLIISLNVALILQSIVLFAFLVIIYFGYFASSHVNNVAAEEANKLQCLTEMKNNAALLALKSGSLSAEYEEAHKLIKRSTDDIRYFSPVNQNRSTETDLEILNVIGNLIELCDTISKGGHPALFEEKTKNFQMLVKERRLLRN
jgi:hypothetical protein